MGWIMKDAEFRAATTDCVDDCQEPIKNSEASSLKAGEMATRVRSSWNCLVDLHSWLIITVDMHS